MIVKYSKKYLQSLYQKIFHHNDNNTTAPNNERNKDNLHVVCVCRGIGFPNGLAQSNRIRLIGKAVVSSGMRFSVLHIGGSPNAFNTERNGIIEGIEFEYLPGILSRPENSIKRKALNIYGTILAILRISAIRAKGYRVCVYTWVGREVYGILFKLILMLFKIPAVQEVNEWYPGAFQWYLHAINLYVSRGSLVISKTIEDRLALLCTKYNISNNLLRIPILIDECDFRSHNTIVTLPSHVVPYLFWCGNVSSYLDDIYFMLTAYSIVKKKALSCQLVIAGSMTAVAEKKIIDHLETLDLDKKDVIMTGYTPDNVLKTNMSQAKALLLPLWNDERSQCRYPTKLGEYLLSERPVITARVGDLQDILVDGHSAYMYNPGDVNDFANKICLVLMNSVAGTTIGQKGKEQGVQKLDYRNFIEMIGTYFSQNASN